MTKFFKTKTKYTNWQYNDNIKLEIYKEAVQDEMGFVRILIEEIQRQTTKARILGYLSYIFWKNKNKKVENKVDKNVGRSVRPYPSDTKSKLLERMQLT